MKVILQIDSGPYAGKKILLRQARTWLGSTQKADLTIPGDVDLADAHFSLDLEGDRLTLRDLDTGQGTVVNGEAIQRAALQNGDRILAGSTAFTVLVEDQPPAPVAPASTVMDVRTAEKPEPMPEEILTAAQLCADLDLEPEASVLLNDEQSPEAFVDVLVEDKQYKDAIRVLAHGMPKRAAVWWACQSTRETCGDSLSSCELAALSAAEAWVAEPSEAKALMAMWESERADASGPGSWSALAAFYSGDSLAPPDLPAVAPGDALTSSGVVSAMLFTAYGNPERAEQLLLGFIEKGKAMRDAEEIDWPVVDEESSNPSV